jgi:hypothetical protein
LRRGEYDGLSTASSVPGSSCAQTCRRQDVNDEVGAKKGLSFPGSPADRGFRVLQHQLR